MAQPWDEQPVWTTLEAVKDRAPYIFGEARSRVARTDPIDPDAAADDFITVCIVAAQQFLVGSILAVVDGPEAVATTYATTPGDLRYYTIKRTIVEVYATDTGGALKPGTVRLEEEVNEWLGGLRMGHRFMSTTGPDDEAAPRSTPPRRALASASAARSALASRARELLS